MTPARIPPFQLPAQGPRRRWNTGQGLRPPDQGPALLHVQMVSTAHGFQVLAEKPRVLSAEAPLWEMWPEVLAGGQKGADPSLSSDQLERPRTPPHGVQSFQSFER